MRKNKGSVSQQSLYDITFWSGIALRELQTTHCTHREPSSRESFDIFRLLLMYRTLIQGLPTGQRLVLWDTTLLYPTMLIM